MPSVPVKHRSERSRPQRVRPRRDLQLAATGLEKHSRPIAAWCLLCQQRRGVQSLRKRGVQTRLGPIGLQRWWHHCWRCGRGWSHLTRRWGWHRISKRARDWHTGKRQWVPSPPSVWQPRCFTNWLACRWAAKRCARMPNTSGPNWKAGSGRRCSTSSKRMNHQPTSTRHLGCWWC